MMVRFSENNCSNLGHILQVYQADPCLNGIRHPIYTLLKDFGEQGGNILHIGCRLQDCITVARIQLNALPPAVSASGEAWLQSGGEEQNDRQNGLLPPLWRPGLPCHQFPLLLGCTLGANMVNSLDTFHDLLKIILMQQITQVNFTCSS